MWDYFSSEVDNFQLYRETRQANRMGEEGKLKEGGNAPEDNLYADEEMNTLIELAPQAEEVPKLGKKSSKRTRREKETGVDAILVAPAQ